MYGQHVAGNGFKHSFLRLFHLYPALPSKGDQGIKHKREKTIQLNMKLKTYLKQLETFKDI